MDSGYGSFMSPTPEEFYSSHGSGWLSERKTNEITEIELEYLKSILDRNWKILDLACGYGRFTIPLAKDGYNIEGIDITPVFIRDAETEAKKNNLNISLRIGDMRQLPYGEEKFDCVICMWNAFSELTTLQDQVRTIVEIERVLKSGGMALIEVRNHRSSGLVEDNKIDGEVAMPSYNHTRGSMKHIMTVAGIKEYDIFLDNFGGRKRLMVKIWKRQI